jgi:hypothetical protein
MISYLRKTPRGCRWEALAFSRRKLGLRYYFLRKKFYSPVTATVPLPYQGPIGGHGLTASGLAN